MTTKLQVSKRLDDGTIIVVGGDTVAEFADNLVGVIGGEGLDAVRAEFYNLIPASAPAPVSFPIEQAAATVQSAFPQAQAVIPPAPPAPPAPQQQQAAPQPPGAPPTCIHGSREWKAGTSKNGKAYKMWSCTADRSQQCDPIWLR